MYYNVVKAMKEDDKINSPSHYTHSKLECIDVIKEMTGDGFEHYLRGNIIKYLWRCNHKNKSPVEDLKKANWYLNRLITLKEEGK